MTNTALITAEQVRLYNEGILSGTGRMIQLLDGTEIEEIEPIHTYAIWKKLGYQVKKGEKAITQFCIWKYVNGKKEVEDEEVSNGHCIMKKASFFKKSQVEKIGDENE